MVVHFHNEQNFHRIIKAIMLLLFVKSRVKKIQAYDYKLDYYPTKGLNQRKCIVNSIKKQLQLEDTSASETQVQMKKSQIRSKPSGKKSRRRSL